MAKKRVYYTLLVRDGERWGIHFGDYDRETVVYEQTDVVQSGEYRKRDTKIITTGNRQVDINIAVELLNNR